MVFRQVPFTAKRRVSTTVRIVRMNLLRQQSPGKCTHARARTHAQCWCSVQLQCYEWEDL